jgi:hypothetical protein
LDRLAVFTDPRDLAARILLPGLLEALAGRTDIRCVALLATVAPGGWRSRLGMWQDRATRCMQVALGSGRWERGLDVPPLDLPRLAVRYGIPLMPLPAGDPNHETVRAYLAHDREANLALNLYCRRLFRQELLDGFDMAVNYHNGRLPAFRGLRASNWSLYLGHAHSGYAFHRMDAGLDKGPILHMGEVAVEGSDTAGDLETRKALEARRHLPDVLDALVRRAPGFTQTGIACNHDRMALELATHVENPSSLNREEWLRRLHAFLRIRTLLEGKWHAVTGLAPGRRPGCLTFLSADGHWLSVTGIDFWPVCWPGWRHTPRGQA